jgi:hypothetical protein
VEKVRFALNNVDCDVMFNLRLSSVVNKV